MSRLTNQFRKQKWWILTVLLTVPVVAAAATVPNIFATGTVISSSQVNANFQSLSDRVTALENAKTAVSIPIFNLYGPLPVSANFTSSGGTLLFTLAGSAYASAPAFAGIDLLLDGNTIGYTYVYVDQANSHRTMPTIMLTAKPAAGTHTITLTNDTYYTLTVTDNSDPFFVTVVETR